MRKNRTPLPLEGQKFGNKNEEFIAYPSNFWRPVCSKVDFLCSNGKNLHPPLALQPVPTYVKSPILKLLQSVHTGAAAIYSGSRYLCSLPLLLIEVHKTLNKYQNVEMQYRPEGRFLFFVYKTVFRSLLHIVFTRKVIKVSGSVIKVSGSHCIYR